MNRQRTAARIPRPIDAAASKARRLAAYATLCFGLAALAAAPATARTFTIGGKAFTEQYVLAEITKQMMEKAGLQARTRVGYATDKIRQAQLAGEVDISWDYSWTGYRLHLGFADAKDPDEALRIVRETDSENGLIWLTRSSVKNGSALAVNLDYAAEKCIHSVDDLAQAIRNGLKVRFASDQECHKREDCLIGMQRAYDFKIPKAQIDVMNVAETHEALHERRADVGVVYITDGKIPAYDLELLEDPKAVTNANYLTPVVASRALEEEPRIRAILEKIAGALDTETSQDLHYRVDIVGQPVEQVAAYFISAKGL